MLIEKHVVSNINNHMLNHHLGEELQSAYLSGHSTETALLKVKDDIIRHIHNREGVFLVLLDLSAAFDTVDHGILLRRMSCEIGVTKRALDWLKSYFTGRSTRVLIDDVYSLEKSMDYGLPQGSIVGPRAFTIYTIPIGRIIKNHRLSYHMYADDIQIYTSFKPI
jgi:retron-type reverse transcriptase